MKTRNFLIGLFAMLSMQNFAQKITVELLINGQKNVSEISKSKDNIVTLTCTNCEQCVLLANGMTLTKISDNKWYLLPNKEGVSGEIGITGYQKGKSIALGRYNFKFIE